MSDRISVILPVRAARKDWRKIIDGILRETCGVHELLLADVAALGNWKGLDSRVRVLDGPFESVEAAILRGAAASEGELLAVADPDTRMDPDMYEKLARLMTEKGADIAVARNRILPKPAKPAGDQNDTELADEPVDPIPRWDTVCSGRKAAYDLLVSEELQGVLWDKLFRRTLFDDLSLSGGDDAFRCEALLEELFARAGSIARLREAAYERRPKSEDKSLRAMLSAVRKDQEYIRLTDRRYPEFQPKIWTAYGEDLEALVLAALAASPEEGLKNRAVLTEMLWPFYRDRGQAALGTLSWQKRGKYKILLQKPEVFWSVWPAIRRVKSFLIHD